jgi:hypothetical protein
MLQSKSLISSGIGNFFFRQDEHLEEFFAKNRTKNCQNVFWVEFKSLIISGFFAHKKSIYLSYANDNIWPSPPLRQI